MTIHPIGTRARAAVEYAELQERLGFARASIEDLHRQITAFAEADLAAGGPLLTPARANARNHALEADNALAACALLVEVMGA